MIGSRAITVSLGVAGVVAGLVLMLAGRSKRAAIYAVMLAACSLALPLGIARAEEVLDEKVRASVLAKKDGRLTRIETTYNDIFITKRRSELVLTTQVRGERYTESVANLSDPDELPMKYAQAMTAALLYPPEPKRILMIGVGGGTIPTYLGRFMPEAQIDSVEIDPGIIKVAKDYFGIVETPRLRYIANDGRVFLNRNKETYDVILLDAFLNGYVPFHLLTKEFFTLLKERLTPGGVAAFNVHDGTRLSEATLVTLRAVFPTVHLYPSGEYETVMVATMTPDVDKETLKARADALQTQYNFRHPMQKILALRQENAPSPIAPVLTDDFAPVNLYDALPSSKKKR
jgi:spermidine synthase